MLTEAQSRTESGTRASIPLLGHLVVLLAVLAVPLVAFTGLVVEYHARSERARMEGKAGDLARDLREAVDRDLSVAASALGVLAASSSLRDGDRQAFAAEARAVARNLGGTVALRDRDGRVLLGADDPAGEAPSATGDGIPGRAVSGLLRGAPSGRPTIRISLPVPGASDREGAARLDLLLDPARIRDTLLRAAPPAGWIVAVVDAEGLLLARTARHEEFVGRGATQDFQANTAGEGGTWNGFTLEGEAIFGAYARSAVSGWRIGVGVPEALLVAPLRNTLAWLSAAGMLCLLLALGAAWAIARRLSRTVEGLADSVRAVGRGEAAPPAPSGVLEVEAAGAALAGVAHDLAERSEAAAASEARFQALAEALPGFVFVADATGAHTYSNPRLVAYSGLTEAQLAGAGWRRLVHPEDEARTAGAWDAAIRTGEPFEVEVRLRAADGSCRWFLARGVPKRDAEGRLVRWVGACTDVDDAVAAREVLARSRDELERLVALRTADLNGRNAELRAEMERRGRLENELSHARRLEAIGQLTGGVAHDFNNLLQVVSNNAGLLAEHPTIRGDEAAAGLLAGLAAAAERGTSLVSHMLAFARRQELRPRVVEAPDLLSRARRLLSQAAGPAAELVVAAPPDAWPVRVDPEQLELALLNLVTNARDAMGGGGTIRITARNARLSWGDKPTGIARGDYVCLSVADTGMGMDAATLSRAVEPFFTTKGVGKGTGLGLAMVHGLAWQSGGAFTLRSRPGEGTTAELWLPRATGAVTKAFPTAPAAPAEPIPAAALRVLLVDDDALVRRTTEALLRRLGHAVTAAGDAEEALDRLAGADAFDLVLTDYAMPGMTGVALAARLREVRPGLPVILATGYADLGEEDAALAASIPRLSKPYGLEELRRAVTAIRGAAVGKVVAAG